MTRYRIVPERSKVVIDARSSLHPIHTEADGLEGWLELDAVPPKAHLEFPVEQLHSGNPFEDRELRRRIDARRFPLITGELTSMEATGTDGRFLVQGDVTFKGVTQTMADEVTVTQEGDDAIRVQGSSAFDVREFGMEPPKILMLKVSPEVAVAVDVVAEKEG